MTYSDKVKASQTIINAINGLSDREHIVVSYGTDYNGEPMQYRIICNVFKSGPSYSITKNDVFTMDGMNFSEISKTTAKAYTYDLMGQKTTYNFPLYEMTIVDQPYLEKENTMEFGG
jgi:hypothetical protein